MSIFQVYLFCRRCLLIFTKINITKNLLNDQKLQKLQRDIIRIQELHYNTELPFVDIIMVDRNKCNMSLHETMLRIVPSEGNIALFQQFIDIYMLVNKYTIDY